MPKFAYVAVTPDGSTTNGVQEAATLAAARLAVVQLGLRIQRIEPKKSWTQLEVTPTRIKAVDLMHLSRQMSAFLRAGIPILDAITTLGEESDKAAVRRVLNALADDLRSGSTLSEAIDKHPADFPEWYRGILRGAELTGRLDDVLDQLSAYIERDVEARKKIKSAMTYPAIVAVMALGTIVILSVWVLPQFETFFSDLNIELPLATRIMLGVSRFMASYWWLVLGVLLLLGLGGWAGTLTSGGKRAWHWLQLRLPVIGDALRYSKVERFTRMLASLVDAGVPLPAAMSVATNSLGSLVFQKSLNGVREAMLSGEGIAGPLAATRLFPGMASQMIRVGEETGTLDTQLGVVAEFYGRELNYKIQRVTTIIEPVVIIVMGGLVGFVAVALVSAMYGVFGAAHIK